MTLQLNISACVSKACSGVTITDSTLPYDVTDNPNGWGSPNLDPSDSGFVATVTITNNGTTTSYDVTDQIPDPVTGEFNITVTHPLTDGISIVTYTVSDGNLITTHSKTLKLFSYCTIKCCIYKKMKNLITFDPCKDKGQIEAYVYQWALFNTMRDLASGCDITAASDLLTRLNRLCGITTTTLKDCGCS